MDKRSTEWRRQLKEWMSEEVRSTSFWVVLLVLSSVLLFLAAVLSSLCVMFDGMVRCDASWIYERLGVTEKAAAFKTLGFTIAGIVAFWGVMAANRRSDALADSAEATAKSAKAAADTAKADEAGNRQQAFKDGVEHLGSEKATVRLIGARALFYVAMEDEKQRAAIASFLCAYIRETTSDKDYQEKHKDKPSTEVQSLLKLLFTTETMDEKGLAKFWQGTTPDLEGGYFCGVKLGDAWFRGAKLGSAQFQRASLDAAEFQGASLDEAQFQGASLDEVQFQGASLDEVQFQRASLKWAQFQGASLDEAQFQGASLGGAQFQKASLYKAQFQKASLKWADIQGASLDEAQFQGASLEGTQFQDASLERTQFQDASLERAQFQDASLEEAQFQGASLERAQFQGASLKWAQFQGASLDRAQFQGASLGEAQFQGASLKRAQFQGASLEWAGLQGASLDGAQFQGASLEETQCQGASLERAQFQGASLEWTEFQGASLEGAQFQGASLREAQFQGASLCMAGFQQAKFRQGWHEDIPAQYLARVKPDELVEKFIASAFHGVSSARNVRESFGERINERTGKKSDLSKVIFAGGVTRELLVEVKKVPERAFEDFDDPDLKKKLVRGLESEIGQPESHTPPKGVIPGSYGKKDAERWIGEFREAMKTVPSTNQAT